MNSKYQLYLIAFIALILPFHINAFAADCQGDFDRSGAVDAGDVAAFAVNYGKTACRINCAGDFNYDGDVDGANLSTIIQNLGKTGCVNRQPVGNAGENQNVEADAVVMLDGSASQDPDGDPLTYRWSFAVRPTDSQATLSDEADLTPSFTADKAGEYSVQLVVNDGVLDSAPVTALITAAAATQPPTIDISADPLTILPGLTVILSWASTDADSVSIDQGIGSMPVNGNTSVTPGTTTTYTATATGPGGSATDSVTVTIDSSITALVGKVTDAANDQPLEGVTVTVTDSNKAQTDVTDANGDYQISNITPGQVSANYASDGYGTVAVMFELTAGNIWEYNVSLDQGAAAASLAGVVTDETSGQPIEGVTVSVTDADKTQSTLSLADGSYFIKGITPGDIELNASRSGYLPVSYQLNLPDPLSYGFDFTLAASAPEPTVTISADPTAVQGGATATLTWSATNAETANIEPDVGSVEPNGSTTVMPSEDTTYTITATGTGGSATATVTIAVTSPISIQITAPANDGTLSKPFVMVTGTFTNSTGNDTGVTVNDQIALVDGNQFAANHVALQEGQNSIKALATDTAGNLKSATISVHAQAANDYIKISAETESGVSPFSTTLTIDGTFDITASSLSNSGPAVDTLNKMSETEYWALLSTNGIYYFTAEVSDAENNDYTDSVAVHVMDEEGLDSLLKAKWNGMKTGLSNQDVPSAVGFFTIETQSLYSDIFTKLFDRLPQISADMQEIQLIYVENKVAKYRIRKNEVWAGEERTLTFYIYFVVDDDGVWKIYRY